MKYLRSTTLGYKDIEIRKSEFVAKTQLLFDKSIIGFMIDKQTNTEILLHCKYTYNISLKYVKVFELLFGLEEMI